VPQKEQATAMMPAALSTRAQAWLPGQLLIAGATALPAALQW